MNKIKDNFTKYFYIFLVYAIIGWLYEVLWMRFAVSPFKWINRGFLYGPYLPIYGFGMLLLYILLNKFINKKHLLSNKLYLTISSITITSFIYITIIEYTHSKIYNVLLFLKDYSIGLIITNIIVLLLINILIKLFPKLKKINTNIVLVFLFIWIIATLIEYIAHYIMAKYFNIILWDYTYDFLNINARVNFDASRNFAIGGTFLLYVVQPIINKLIKFMKNKTIITIILLIIIVIDFILSIIF